MGTRNFSNFFSPSYSRSQLSSSKEGRFWPLSTTLLDKGWAQPFMFPRRPREARLLSLWIGANPPRTWSLRGSSLSWSTAQARLTNKTFSIWLTSWRTGSMGRSLSARRKTIRSRSKSPFAGIARLIFASNTKMIIKSIILIYFKSWYFSWFFYQENLVCF